MALWFNEARDGKKVASIGGDIDNATNATIKFDEAIAYKQENGYLLLIHLLDTTGVSIMGDKLGVTSLAGKIVTLNLYNADYEKYDYKSKERVKKQATPIELYLCKQIDANPNWLTGVKGKIKINNDVEVLDAIATADDASQVEFYVKALHLVQATELSKFDETILTEVQEKLTKTKGGGGGNGGGYKSQTEYERLNDRVKFVLEQTGQKSLAELAAILASESGKPNMYTVTLTELLQALI